jgi:hypothetical protein
MKVSGCSECMAITHRLKNCKVLDVMDRETAKMMAKLKGYRGIEP